MSKSTIKLDDAGIAHRLRYYRELCDVRRKCTDAYVKARDELKSVDESIEAIKSELGGQAKLRGQKIVHVGHDGIAFIVPVPPSGYPSTSVDIDEVPICRNS